jgi:O-antigen ligase
MLVLLIVIGGFLFSSTTPRLRAFGKIQPESLTLRQDLNIAAIEMIKKSPIIGVGLGNFLVRLPEFYQGKGQVRFLQPAHNIYLMIAAETGLVGLGLFLWFLFLTYRHLRGVPQAQHHLGGGNVLIALISILLLGFFDHYFYTLQQGQLLATLILSLAWSSHQKDSMSFTSKGNSL